MKKIALLLAFILLISTFPVCAASEEVQTSAVTKQAKVLMDLKLLDEYDENASVTQGMLYNAIGTITDNETYADMYFTDYKLDNSLEYTECIMVMLDFLGYGEMIKNSSGTYNYSSASKQCGLTSGLALKSGDIKMKEYTRLLYNLLNTNLLEVSDYINKGFAKSSDTVMSKYFDAKEYTGIVTSAGKVSINSTDELNKNTIKIGKNIYTCYLDNKEDVVGYNVVAWIDKDDEVLSVYADENKNKDLTIEARALHDASQSDDGHIRYMNGSSERTVDIKSGVDVVYGGTFYPDGLKIADLDIASGCIKLIDNNTDGDYDVIFINNYVNEVVDIYAPSNMTLRTKDGGSYDIEDYVEDYGDILDSKGKGVKLSNMTVNNIVSIRKNKAGIPTDIVLCIQKENGVLRGVDLSDYTITIGDKVCPLAYDRLTSYKKDAVSGDEVTAFTNTFGEVVYVLVYSASSQYAYVISCKMNDEDQCIIRLVNAECENIKLTSDDKIKYNGTKVAPTVYYNDFKQGVIKYSVNADGRIKSIDTPKNNHSLEVKPKDYFSLDYDTTRYDAQGMYVVNGDFSVIGSRYALTSETLVFYIPSNGKPDDFYARYGNDLSDTSLYSNCQLYDVNEDYEVGVITASYNPGTGIYASDLGIVVTKILDTVSVDGDQAVQIEGYQNGEKVSFITSNTDVVSGTGNGSKGGINIMDITRGSIIQVGRNFDNEIDALNVLYLAKDDEKDGVYEWCDNSPRGWYGATQYFFNGYGLSAYGKVLRRTTRGFIFNGHTPDTGEGIFPVRTWDRFIGLEATVPVMVYERGSGNVTVGTAEDITTDDWIFIQIGESRMKTLIVYKD